MKYDSDFGAWLQFLRTGDDRWREMAEALTGYLELLMLHDVVTDTGYDVWRWRDAIFGHSQHGETGNQNGQRNYLGPVSDTAYGSRGALLHYYLTGDPVSKRFIDKAAEHMYMFYSDEYYPDKRFEGLSYLSNSASREYANALSTLVEGFRDTGDVKYLQLAGEIIGHFSPDRQPWFNGPRAGSEGYVSSWQLTMYLAAVGRYAELARENGLAEAAQAAESLLVDYTNWILSFATKDHNGEYSIFYSWDFAGGNDPDGTDMITNWMLLMADVCAYAYKITGERIYLENGKQFFQTAVNDPSYLGDAPTYTSLKEAVNQVTFGHVYLYYAETLDELPPDSEPPRVSLLAPADGVSVSGVIPLEVDTSDNTGVLRVTYQLNGEKIAGAYIDPFTTAWNTTRTANGTYILTAKAFDYRGNWTESSAITFSIDNIIDETPPEITLVRPGDGETVSGTTSSRLPPRTTSPSGKWNFISADSSWRPFTRVPIRSRSIRPTVKTASTRSSPARSTPPITMPTAIRSR